MTAISVTIFAVLAAIAVLHLAWGFGVHWPAGSERDLAALVVGKTGRHRMPGLAACVAAATAIFVAAVIALAAGHGINGPVPPVSVTVVSAFVALVFAGRGMAAYLPVWRRAYAQEPFATADRYWYGPFCLLLAAGYAVLVLKRVWF